jgi:hypothetical protein
VQLNGASGSALLDPFKEGKIARDFKELLIEMYSVD